MCIGIAQYKLDYGKSFRETDLARINQFKDLSASIDLLNPNNLRINLWKEGIIVVNKEKLRVQRAQFAWLEPKKSGGTWPVFNVRVEGGWNNKQNDPEFTGPYQIYSNPYVKGIISSQRCLIPCDFFIEQNSDKKDKRKFLIQRENQSPIHLGGIYKEMVDEESGEIKQFFTILTNPSNSITQAVGHQRSPVIINDEDLERFLDPKLSKMELEVFFKPNNKLDFEAYEVDPIISKVKCPLAQDDLKLREAIGETIRV